MRQKPLLWPCVCTHWFSAFIFLSFLCLLLSSGCSFLPADAHLWHFICICFPDYLSKPYTFCFHFSQLLTLLWITVFIQRFGWDCGVQHFLFVLLVLNFAVSFHRIRTKIFVGICTCAYRLLLYSYTRYHLPVIQLSTDASICIQTIDTLFILQNWSRLWLFHPEFPADGTQAYTLQSGTGTHRIHRSPDRAFQPLADV